MRNSKILKQAKQFLLSYFFPLKHLYCAILKGQSNSSKPSPKLGPFTQQHSLLPNSFLKISTYLSTDCPQNPKERAINTCSKSLEKSVLSWAQCLGVYQLSSFFCMDLIIVLSCKPCQAGIPIAIKRKQPRFCNLKLKALTGRKIKKENST